MGSMFRSEQMVLCQMYLQPEAAYSCMTQLGEAGVAQFRDINPEINNFQRQFVNEVRRCGEMERRLRYIAGELAKDSISCGAPTSAISALIQTKTQRNARDIVLLEERLEQIETEILELSENTVALKTNYLELIELKLLIERTKTFFSDQQTQRKFSTIREPSAGGDNLGGHLGFVAGVLASSRLPAFEKMLWRISHGNVFLRYVRLDEPLEDPTTGHELHKTVFVIFVHGDELKLRIKKVCSGFKATLYPCPSDYKEQQDMLAGVNTRIEDLKMILNQTKDHRSRVLVNIARSYNSWMISVKKEKAIYHTLNMFSLDIVKKCLIGECWVPQADLRNVQIALTAGGKACGSPIPCILNFVTTEEVPPTFNRTNKFTRGFQNLIDSYGVASYREVNPALYTIITFPFLFAVMFGDVGHALIMTTFAIYMIGFERKFLKEKTDNEIWNIFFSGRYIILLMGMFSLYTGIIYNDFFSKSLNIFGSSWKNLYNESTLMHNKFLQLNPGEGYSQSPYPFGLDPAWQFAENNVSYLNSYKMKLSIIFGVIHMAFGICMSVVNLSFFKKSASIILEFIPQIVFLVLLFWYLCVLMILKWIIYSPIAEDSAFTPACAPSVLVMFINMMLMKQSTALENCKPMMFEGQEVMQKIFLFIALACIPIMLFGKPVYTILTQPKKAQTGSVISQEEKDNSFGELMIHQGIHTIEFALGTVSHTASYLRLWALSLAHARLSAVLWQRLLSLGLQSSSYAGSVMLFVIFAAWAFFTIAILVLMEGLSAFLHTLRLHWVEFMSKFYEGLGYPFSPYSFKIILEQAGLPAANIHRRDSRF